LLASEPYNSIGTKPCLRSKNWDQTEHTSQSIHPNQNEKFRENTRSPNHTGIEPVAAGDARPGREVVVEEEGRNKEVKGAHGDGGVLVRQPRGRRRTSPVRLRVHPLVGAAVELAGGEGSRRGYAATSPDRLPPAVVAVPNQSSSPAHVIWAVRTLIQRSVLAAL